MTQRIAVLGATGSIGDSTLELLERHPERFEVYALSGYSRLDKLLTLCQRHRPKYVVVPLNAVGSFKRQCKANGLDVSVVGGEQGLVDIASDSNIDTVVAAIVGAAGLASTLSAAKSGKRILLANKEALVMAGSLMMQAVKDCGATLLPLDSEHNAIFQCLPFAVQQDNQQIHSTAHGIKKLWLTASGGPFLSSSYEQMQQASVSEAVKHPNWSMGKKISVDSATMMNKGLELIEACHLFDMPERDVDVVMHPQSIVHSLVEYTDGSFLAQLGSPDMKTPIAHALSYPERINSNVASLNLFELSHLEFIQPDLDKFQCLSLARQAMRSGQAASIALNAANEITVQAFIDEQVKLTDIALINAEVLSKMSSYYSDRDGYSFNDLKDILYIDKKARNIAHTIVNDHSFTA